MLGYTYTHANRLLFHFFSMLADDLKLSSDEDDSDKVWVLLVLQLALCVLGTFFHGIKYQNTKIVELFLSYWSFVQYQELIV